MKKILSLTLSVIALVVCQSSVQKDTLKDAFRDNYLIGVAVSRTLIHQRDE